MFKLTLANDLNDLVTTNSLEHEERTEALVEGRLAGRVEKGGAERGELLGGDGNSHCGMAV